MSEPVAPTVVGRYVLHAPIARGGMATIYLARLLGAEGFSRMVAAKRLHPQLAEDDELVEMLLDEARIASKIHHPNVVPVLDVVRSGAEVILVQEYVHGVPLDKLLRAASQARELLPTSVVVTIAADVLAGLAAAHDARDELGASLGIVHRDVSPQNVLVGADGIARLLDFGIAKASLNAHVTRVGVFKGKVAYTSPEQLRGLNVTHVTDLYAAGVMIWEALAGRRMHPGLREAELMAAVSAGATTRLTDAVDRGQVTPQRWATLERLGPVLDRAMSFAPEDRWKVAAEMREALLDAEPAATVTEVSRCVKQLGKEYLEGREKLIVAEESTWRQRASAVPVSIEDPSTNTPLAANTGAGTLRPSEIPVLRERGHTAWMLPAALTVIGALLGGILLLLLRRPAAPASAGPPPEVATSAPAPLPRESVVTRTADPAPTASATATASSAATSAPPRAPTRPLPALPRVAPAPTSAPAAPPDCSPPFYFDGKKKVFKPGCL